MFSDVHTEQFNEKLALDTHIYWSLIVHNLFISSDKMNETSQDENARATYNDGDAYHDSNLTYTHCSAKYFLQKMGIFSTNDEVLMKSNNSLTVLELGCGTGLFTAVVLDTLRGKYNIRYIATDPGESMKKTFVKNFPDVEFYLCKAENLRKWTKKTIENIGFLKIFAIWMNTFCQSMRINRSDEKMQWLLCTLFLLMYMSFWYVFYF